jgi:hypothetical protein
MTMHMVRTGFTASEHGFKFWNSYDPNHPGETPTLTMNLTKPSVGIALAQSTGEALRGFS